MLQKLNIFLFITIVMIFSNCEKERCLNCNIYDLLTFNLDLQTFSDSLRVCENEDLWDEIVWGEYNTNNDIDIINGGDFSFIDLDIYTLGYRSVENLDIDGDGIPNHSDDDVDGDGSLNYEDTTPYGINSNTVLELLICIEK
tara:strand:- start:21 stop:446 length:426 start_codon:yes stop_codon:yes gene_type:complete